MFLFDPVYNKHAIENIFQWKNFKLFRWTKIKDYENFIRAKQWHISIQQTDGKSRYNGDCKYTLIILLSFSELRFSSPGSMKMFTHAN